MARPTNKQALLEAAENNFSKLWQLLGSMSAEALNAEFDFSSLANKKEAHWRRDKNVRDVLVHLFEWHQLLLQWLRSNMAGQARPFLPAPYNWKNYAEMNQQFWLEHQQTPLARAQQMLMGSHQQVILLIETYTQQQLFTKEHYDWTGTTTLGSYCISATSSHYDWAYNKLKTHLKTCC